MPSHRRSFDYQTLKMAARCTSDLATAKAVNHQLHCAETWVHSHASVDKVANGQIFFSKHLSFPPANIIQ
jgi:hypothetical protein